MCETQGASNLAICNNLDVLSAVRRSQQPYGLPNRAAARRSGLNFLSHLRTYEVTNCDLNPEDGDGRHIASLPSRYGPLRLFVIQLCAARVRKTTIQVCLDLGSCPTTCAVWVGGSNPPVPTSRFNNLAEIVEWRTTSVRHWSFLETLL